MPTTTLGGPAALVVRLRSTREKRSPDEIDMMATVREAFDPREREFVSIGALPAAALAEEG